MERSFPKKKTSIKTSQLIGRPPADPFNIKNPFDSNTEDSKIKSKKFCPTCGARLSNDSVLKCPNCNGILKQIEHKGIQRNAPDPRGKQGNPVLNPTIPLERGLGRPINPYQRQASVPPAVIPQETNRNTQPTDVPMVDNSLLDELGHPVIRHDAHLDNVSQSADFLGL